MWRDILMANREEILKQTQRFRHTLDAMEHVIKTGNAEALEDADPQRQRRARRLADERADAAHAPLRPPRRRRRRRMFTTPLPRHPAARGAAGTVRAAGLEEHLQPRAAAGRLQPTARRASTDLLDSDDTRVMLDALRAARLRHRSATAPALARHRPRRPAAGAGSRPLPRQRRHGDAAAGRGAGAAGADAGGALRAARRAAHARAADRRPGRRAAPARLRDRLPRQRRAIPPLRVRAGAGAARRSSAPIRRARRRLEPVPHRAAARAAAASPARAGATIEVDGELISKPYVDITLQPARALRRRRASATAGSASRPGAAARYRSPGALRRRRRRVVGVVLHRRRRDRRAAARRCASKASAATRSRATSASSTPPARWARRSTRGAALRSTVRRGRLPLAPIDARLQPHPRRGDDAGGAGAVRRRHRRALTQHRQLARQGDRPPGGDGRPSCASSAPTVVEGADFLAITPPRALARRSDRDLRRPPDGDVLVARGVQRRRRRGAALPVRILDPRCVAKTFPDYFEALFAVASARPGDDPGAHDRRPDRLGQGHAGERGRRRARLPPARLRRALPRHRARRAAGRRRRRRRSRRSPRWPRALRPALRRRPDAASTAPTSPMRSASRKSARSPRASPPGPRVRDAAARRCSWRSAACPAWSPTAATWAPSSSPTPTLKVFLTASAAERAERRHKQLISKGISANIDSLRADLEARDARDHPAQRRARSKPAEDALLLDNSALSIEASVAAVLEAWEAAQALRSNRSVAEPRRHRRPRRFPPRAAIGHTEAPDPST